jgi:hypothetical protein
MRGVGRISAASAEHAGAIDDGVDAIEICRPLPQVVYSSQVEGNPSPWEIAVERRRVRAKRRSRDVQPKEALQEGSIR